MASQRGMRFLIATVFFLSGAAALVFQTIWFKLASMALGSSIWSAAAVLMAFMLGLGLGHYLMARYGYRVRQPFNTYIAIEIFIGLAGVGVVFILPFMGAALAAIIPYDPAFAGLTLVVRFTVALILFLLPAVAMGMTLPLLQKGLRVYYQDFMATLGHLYGWNTLGAMTGALLTEFVFIRFFGLQGSALFACVLNFIAAWLLLRGVGRTATVVEQTPNLQQRLSRWDTPIAAFLAGFTLLALEIVWFRYLLLSRNGTTLVFAMMLAIVLAGIGVGGLLVSRIRAQEKTVAGLIYLLPLLSAIWVMLGFGIYQWVYQHEFVVLFSQLWAFILYATVLMFPTACLSGMLFPLYGQTLFSEAHNETLITGKLTLLNTLGAALGVAVATFYLLPVLGIAHALFVLALCYVVLALIPLSSAQQACRRALAPIAIAVAIILLFPYDSLDRTYRVYAKHVFPKEQLIYTHEGLNQTLQYYQLTRLGKPYAFRLVTNSYSMTATHFIPKRYMALFAYFPYILKRDIHKALLISYGVGSTAEAITRLPGLQSLDVVDISPDILRLSKIIHAHTGYYPLHDARTTINIEDGRYFLQTTKQRFDLITGEPPPPKLAGVVNLYTQEYFALLRSRLREGGMVTYWLPAHDLDTQDSQAIIGAFCQVFTHCSLWNSGGLNFMLLGVKGDLPHLSLQQLAQPWQGPLAPYLADIGLEQPGQLPTLFMADSRLLASLTLGVAPLVDNYPYRISPELGAIHRYSKIYDYMLSTSMRETLLSVSRFSRRLFSPEVIAAAKPYWKSEYLLTLIYLPKSWHVQVPYWVGLADTLRLTDLKVLPLLMLHSSPAEQAIFRDVKPRLSTEYLVAAIADSVSRRDYLKAMGFIQRLKPLLVTQQEQAYYQQLTYLLKALAGQLSVAQLDAAYQQTPTLLDEDFVIWLKEYFWQIPPPRVRAHIPSIAP